MPKQHKNLIRLGSRFSPRAAGLQSAVQETLAWIDGVHLGPEMPLVSVAYYAELHPFGRYVPGDSRPECIELSLIGPHPHLTFAHEVGHLLDQALLGYNGYASQSGASVLREVLRALRRSQAYQSLQILSATAGQEPLEQIARQRARYWLGAEETWARAYAQYIAVRSGSETLREEIAIALSLESHAASSYVQWEEADFASVATAIDATFRKLGWKP